MTNRNKQNKKIHFEELQAKDELISLEENNDFYERIEAILRHKKI